MAIAEAEAFKSLEEWRRAAFVGWQSYRLQAEKPMSFLVYLSRLGLISQAITAQERNNAIKRARALEERLGIRRA